jgi:hypothetical protein
MANGCIKVCSKPGISRNEWLSKFAQLLNLSPVIKFDKLRLTVPICRAHARLAFLNSTARKITGKDVSEILTTAEKVTTTLPHHSVVVLRAQALNCLQIPVALSLPG